MDNKVCEDLEFKREIDNNCHQSFTHGPYKRDAKPDITGFVFSPLKIIDTSMIREPWSMDGFPTTVKVVKEEPKTNDNEEFSEASDWFAIANNGNVGVPSEPKLPIGEIGKQLFCLVM